MRTHWPGWIEWIRPHPLDRDLTTMSGAFLPPGVGEVQRPFFFQEGSPI